MGIIYIFSISYICLFRSLMLILDIANLYLFCRYCIGCNRTNLLVSMFSQYNPHKKTSFACL